MIRKKLEGIQESEEVSERQSDANIEEDFIIDVNLPRRQIITPVLSQQNSFTLKMNQSIKEEEFREHQSEEEEVKISEA